MRLSALAVAAALLCAGCYGPIDAAIRTANATRELGVAGAAFLDDVCTRGYARANDGAAIAELDRVCLPAARAYRGVRGAHVALVAAVQVAQAGGSADSLGPAVALATQAAADLQRAILGGR